MSTSRDLAQIVELAPRLAAYYTDPDINGRTIWQRMYDDMAGHPTAAAWDDSRTTEAWCWTHGRAVQHCHTDGHICMGDPMSGPSDPTGRAATTSRDAAADDERTARDTIARIARLLVTLEDIATRYKPARPPSLFEREQSGGNEPQCGLCARWRDDRKKPYWSQPILNGAGKPYKTTVGDVLDQAAYVCQFCHRHITRKGCPPNEQETRDHHEKGKMTCHHPDRAAEEVA